MKRGREYHGFGGEYNAEKKGKGKQYLLFFNVKAVGKNIKWGREERSIEKLRKKIKIKNISLGRISNCRELYTPLNVDLVDGVQQ